MATFREWLAAEVGQSESLDIDTYAEHILAMISVLDPGEEEEAIEDFLTEVLPKGHLKTTQLKDLVRQIIQKAQDENNSSSKKDPPKKEIVKEPVKSSSEAKKKEKSSKVMIAFGEPSPLEPSLWSPSVLDEHQEPTNPMEMLADTFPNLDIAFLEDQLQLANLDLTLTVARILEWIQTEQEESQRIQEEVLFDQLQVRTGVAPLVSSSPQSLSSLNPPAPSGSSRPPICRHFLAGTCFRADCWYSHDTQVTVCTFWLRGNCIKGDKCEFLHGVDLGSLTSARQPDTSSSSSSSSSPQPLLDFIGTETDFPQLPNASAPPRQPAPQVSSGQLDAASIVKLSNMMEEFHWVSKSSVRDIYLASGTLEESRNRLAYFFPKTSDALVPKGRGQPKSSEAASSLSSKTRLPGRSSEQPVERRPAHWVETGASLTVDYFRLREKAIEHAVARNKCFQRATEFFLRGDGAMAKKCSLEGRYHDEEMKKIHQEAADEMFQKRNQNTAAGSRSIIDLHGLHADEACSKLRQKISELKRQMYSGSLYIITGTGHHSYDHNRKRLATEGKVGPAVLRLLRDLGFSSPLDASTDQRGGMLSISFS